MKNLLQIAALAGFIAVTSVSASFAGEYPIPTQLKRSDRVSEYWIKESQANSSQQSDSAASQAIRTYPCAHCVYDARLGGYVKKQANKR